MRNDPRRRDLANYAWMLEVPTRFEDMDPNRHLNNVAVMRLFEETRVRFNWKLRASHPDIGHPHFLVGHASVDYLAEGEYPTLATMGYAVLSIGTSSFRIGKGLFQKGECVALCDTVMVHRGDSTPTAPIPPALRIALEAFPLRG